MRDFPVPLVLKRSARAKRLRLTVKPSGVECVIPVALSEHRAWDFIEQHRDWLIGKFRGSIARRAQSNLWQTATDGQPAALAPGRAGGSPLLSSCPIRKLRPAVLWTSQ